MTRAATFQRSREEPPHDTPSHTPVKLALIGKQVLCPDQEPLQHLNLFVMQWMMVQICFPTDTNLNNFG